MLDSQSENTANTLEWFAENLPPDYLTHPEYFLYSTALDVQQMQDVPESRRRFKQVLVERQVGEGMELPQIDQRQIHDFMNPNDTELKLQRADEFLKLTTKHLEETQDFAQAQRLAILELFHKEAPFRQVEMDEGYFRNRELVEADLRAYLGHAKGDYLTSLSTGNPKSSVSITTQNSELVKWQAYLKRASGVLFGTEDNKKRDNLHRSSGALKALIRIADPTIPEYIPMNEEYFNNPEYVKADLTGYLQYAKGDSFTDLHTENPKPSTSIRTQSGEQLKWKTYLTRASGVLLGTTFQKDNFPRRPDALRALIRIADETISEYIPMDEKYFNDPEIVKVDLAAYFRHAKGDSLVNLKSSNPKPSISIQTQSGEQVKWQAYLKRASGVLFGTKSRGDNLHRPPDVLKALLKIAGVNIPEYIPMDKEYFNNPEYVKADLTAYLQHAKGDSLKDLNTYNPKPSISIQTQSGEQVKWQTYLNRASGVLFGTRNNKKSDNPPRYSKTLKKLREIAQQADACNSQSPIPNPQC